MSSKKYPNYLEEDEYIRINHDKPEKPYIKIEHDSVDGINEYQTNDTTTDERTINDRQELEKYNKKVTGATAQKYFCVFRIGKKFKNFSMLQRYQYHVTREGNVLNADPDKTKFNEILIGSENIVQDVKEYIKDIPFIRSNGNIAFDLVLTAHHEFFDGLTDSEKRVWINHNIEFLKNTFGENCTNAVAHKDETALHLHCVVVPKFWNQKQLRYELQSNKYLDGFQKLQGFQTDYADYMQKKFSNLVRGIKGSKAHHTDIKTYYSILSKKLDLMDDRSVETYAKYSFLLEKKNKALERTLKIMEENGDQEKLLKKLDKTERNNKTYLDIIDAITKKYGIKEKEIIELADRVQGKNNSQKER